MVFSIIGLDAQDFQEDLKKCKLYLGLMRAEDVQIEELSCENCGMTNQECSCDEISYQEFNVEFEVNQKTYDLLVEYYRDNDFMSHIGQMSILDRPSSYEDSMFRIKIEQISRMSHLAGAIEQQISTWMAPYIQTLLHSEGVVDQNLRNVIQLEYHLQRNSQINSQEQIP